MLELKRLGPDDEPLMRSMIALFGRAFDAADEYVSQPPSSFYLRSLLSDPSFLAIAASENGAVVGGLAAYILTKFEQERREVYLYDLAVDERHRRRGIATALIERLIGFSAELGIHIVFVQADHEDRAAIALYSKFAKRRRVVQFELTSTLASPRKPT